MLQAAGLPITHRTWSRDDILRALSAWIAANNTPPTMADWNRPIRHRLFPTPGCVADCFGSWNAMLIAAGVKPNRRYWTPQDIVAVCAAFEDLHGRQVRAEELNSPGNGLPSVGAVKRHIGNHQGLLDAINAMRSATALSSPPQI
jgi:hypothetical protein